MRCPVPIWKWTVVLLTIWLVLVLAGCDRQVRAQAASDARAGLWAAKAAAEAGATTADIVAILQGVEKYLPAASGVNPADWPAPTMSPAQIVKDPAGYGSSAPPEPARWGADMWSALVLSGGLLAWAAKRALPLVPGVGGPAKALIELGAEVLWKVTASADQKQADHAQVLVQSAAAQAAPVLEALRALPVESLPPEIRRLLDRPIVVQAVHHLADVQGAA